MNSGKYTGLLVIGDPHVESRQPGFRKDDYPSAILGKLAWCLDYAAVHRLLPALLGDLFDKPRDNPNWLLVKLIELFRGEVIGLYGNHDCADPVLKENDSLSVLVGAGRLRLVSAEQPWQGVMNGRPVIVGGSSYRQPLPPRFVPPASASPPLVVWLAHHDVADADCEVARHRPHEIPGVDLLINGHIHRRRDEVRAGRTRWITPGNISRVSRSDATRDHIPSVLRIDVSADGYELTYVEVPHRPFEEVFHELVQDAPTTGSASAFVAGLAELVARRTASGAGLAQFLDQNVSKFPPAVAAEIRLLAQEVTSDGNL